MIKSIINRFIKGNRRSELAKKQIIYSFLLNGISVAISLLYIPILLNYLDRERYGVWLTLISIVGWFTFFDAGLGNGLRHNLTKALAKGDMVLAKEYISTTYAIIGLIFLSVLGLFFIINPFLHWNNILNTKLLPEKELSLLALIVFTFFFLRFILNLIGVILNADQRPAWNIALSPIINIITLAIIYLLTKTLKNSFIIMGLVVSFIPVFVLLTASLLFFNRRYKLLKPKFRSINWSHSKLLMNLGFKFFIIQIATLIMFQSSNMIIAHIFGPNEVVVYNIASKYFQIPIMLYGTIMTPIWSAVTDAYVKEDFIWLKSTLKKLNKISLLFSLLIITMLIISQYMYIFWVGEKISVPFLLSSAIAFHALINVILTPYSIFLNGMGKIYLVSRLVWISIILYIPTAILLAKTPLNLAGVTIAIVIINIFGMPFQIYQTNKLLNNKAYGIWNK